MNFPNPDNVSPTFRLFFQSGCAVCLFFYFYILFVIVKHFKEIGRSFHILVFNMAPIDIVELIVTSLWVYLHPWAMRETQKRALFAFAGYVSQGTALNQLALATSRFAAIMFYRKMSKRIEWRLTFGLFVSSNLLCIVWTAACSLELVVVPTYINCSLLYFSPVYPGYYLLLINQIFCVLTAIIMYGSCFVYFSTMRNKSSLRLLKKRESKLLLQSAVLCFNQILVLVFFSISADGSSFASYGAQMSSLLNYGGNPFVYVAFSTELRQKAFPFLFKNDDNRENMQSMTRKCAKSDTDAAICDLLEGVV